MSTIEDLLKDVERDNDSYGTRVIEDAELEFKGLSTIEKEREEDRQTIQTEINKLRAKLRETKNVRNYRKTEINKIKSEKRKIIKQQIAMLELKLEDIKIEKEGSGISSDTLLKPN